MPAIFVVTFRWISLAAASADPVDVTIQLCHLHTRVVWCGVLVTEPAEELTEEEKLMQSVMGFHAFSTTKVFLHSHSSVLCTALC